MQRLGELNIEWLIERFKELTIVKQLEFMKMVKELMEGKYTK